MTDFKVQFSKCLDELYDFSHNSGIIESCSMASSICKSYRPERIVYINLCDPATEGYYLDKDVDDKFQCEYWIDQCSGKHLSDKNLEKIEKYILSKRLPISKDLDLQDGNNCDGIFDFGESDSESK